MSDVAVKDRPTLPQDTLASRMIEANEWSKREKAKREKDLAAAHYAFDRAVKRFRKHGGDDMLLFVLGSELRSCAKTHLQERLLHLALDAQSQSGPKLSGQGVISLATLLDFWSRDITANGARCAHARDVLLGVAF